MELMNNQTVLLTLTFGVYFLARQLQKRIGWLVLNPILVTIAVLIIILKQTNVSYDTYKMACAQSFLAGALYGYSFARSGHFAGYGEG